MSKRDLYDVLGVSRGCTREEIVNAFRRLCKTHHPDKGGNHDDFVEIQKAYEILTNDEKRHLYDTTGVSDRAQYDVMQRRMERARQELCGLYQDTLEGSKDPITGMRYRVQAHLKHLRMEHANLIGTSAKLRKANKRLIVKNKNIVRSNDPLVRLLRQKRIEIWQSYRVLKDARAMYRLVLELLDGYDIVPEPTTTTTTTFTNGYTTWTNTLA